TGCVHGWRRCHGRRHTCGPPRRGPVTETRNPRTPPKPPPQSALYSVSDSFLAQARQHPTLIAALPSVRFSSKFRTVEGHPVALSRFPVRSTEDDKGSRSRRHIRSADRTTNSLHHALGWIRRHVQLVVRPAVDVDERWRRGLPRVSRKHPGNPLNRVVW